MTCEWLLLATSWLLVASPLLVAVGLMVWAFARINREPVGDFTGDQIDGGGR